MAETSEVAWRREWDSNPRYLLEHTAFRGQLLKPLGHLSEGQYSIMSATPASSRAN